MKLTEFYPEKQGRPESKAAIDTEKRAPFAKYTKLASFLATLKDLTAYKEDQEELRFLSNQIIKAILTNIGGGVDWDDEDLWDIDWEEIDSLTHGKRHEAGGSDELHLKGTGIELSKLGLATYSNVQDLINSTMSAGRISGGAITASGSAGNLSVAEGSGFIKTTNSAIGDTKFFDWSTTVIVAGAAAGNIIDLDANYIYIDYSTGLPIVKATTDRTAIELNRMFTLGRVYRSGTTLHIVNSGIHLDNSIRLNHERLVQVRGFERASGGVVSETGTRYLVTTAGVFFLGANKVTTAINDTSGNGHTLTRWYHDASGWVSNTGVEGASAAGQVSNEHYDTGAALADIGIARYGVFWVFIHFDGDLHVVYGRGSYKLAEAENATVPTVPEAVSEFGTLAAKIIVAQGGSNFTSIVTAYETLFPVSSVPDHGELTGLADDDHTQYIKDTEFTQNSGILVGTGNGTFAEETGATLRTSIGVYSTAQTDTAIDTDISTHSALTSGTHGVGSDKVASDAQALMFALCS